MIKKIIELEEENNFIICIFRDMFKIFIDSQKRVDKSSIL